MYSHEYSNSRSQNTHHLAGASGVGNALVLGGTKAEYEKWMAGDMGCGTSETSCARTYAWKEPGMVVGFLNLPAGTNEGTEASPIHVTNVKEGIEGTNWERVYSQACFDYGDLPEHPESEV